MSDHRDLDFLNDPFSMFVIKETSLIKFSECDFKEKKLSHIECNNILVANLQIVSLIAVFSVQVSLASGNSFFTDTVSGPFTLGDLLLVCNVNVLSNRTSSQWVD